MSRDQAYAEMEEALGLVPSFFARMPDATVELEWKLFRDSDENGGTVFRHVALPSDAEVARVTERICRQVSKLLDRRGLGPQASHKEPDALQHSQPLIAELYKPEWGRPTRSPVFLQTLRRGEGGSRIAERVGRPIFSAAKELGTGGRRGPREILCHRRRIPGCKGSGRFLSV